MPNRTKQYLSSQINAKVIENDQGLITATVLNVILKDFIDSFREISEVDDDSGLSSIAKYDSKIVWVKGTSTLKIYNGVSFETLTVGGLTELQINALVSPKVDKVVGKGLSANDFTNTLLNKLNNIAANATANESDEYLLSRGNHTGSQAISTITGLATQLLDIYTEKSKVSVITSATYAVQRTDKILFVDASLNSVNIILPEFVESEPFQSFIIKRIDSSGDNLVTVYPSDYDESLSVEDAEKIDNLTEYSLASQNDFMEVVEYPSEDKWFVIRENA